MKLLHLSHRENRDNILSNGIIPSYIKLDAHFEAFSYGGLKSRECVYMWDSEKGQSTDKYIRDMIYCKLFIHPRNDLGDAHYKNLESLGIMDYQCTDEQKLDYRSFGTKLFGDGGVFDLYEITIDENNEILLPREYVHGQTKDESPYASCYLLNEKYAHEDKILRISGSTITPDMFKIVDSIKARTYKDDTIGISYSKSI
jgi:hypothetical protein